MKRERHGWVVPLPNGLKARCGGPGMCSGCQAEARGWHEPDCQMLRPPPPGAPWPLSEGFSCNCDGVDVERPPFLPEATALRVFPIDRTGA